MPLFRFPLYSPASSPRLSHCLLGLGGALVWLSACAKSPEAPSPAASSALPKSTSSGPALAKSETAPPTPLTDYTAAARMDRWREVARIIDALPAERRAQPEVRFVRARAAAQLDDHKQALTLLDGLEAKLPMLSSEIEQARAEAQLEVGPFDAAARYFGRRADADGFVKAALAYERAKKPEDVLKSVGRALTLLSRVRASKRRASEAEARAIRARAAVTLKRTQLAAADLSWLAIEVPDLSPAASADEQLEALLPGKKLTTDQRYARAMLMAKAGQVEAVESELSKLLRAPGRSVGDNELAHARGWALYMSRSDYAKASELLEKAARGGKEAARDLFYAARARSRADQDELAITMYKKLAARYSGSSFAEEARYLIARLHYIGGDWKAAASAYDDYLRRYKTKGRFEKTASYERAVSWLAGKQFKQASKAFEALADDSDSGRLEASYRNLRAVALNGAGQKVSAVREFRRVIRDRPLSFSALAAAARLKQMSEPVPPLIEPAKVDKPLPELAVKLPGKVQLLHGLGLDADAERELARVEDDVKRAHGSRGDEALCKAYGQLSRAGRRYGAGQRAARWQELSVAPSEKTRWLWECIYPRPYEDMVRAAEREHQLPRDFVYAVMRQESGFRPAVVSHARAVGLLQLIPPTAKQVAQELSINYDPGLLASPPENIRMGTYYLAKVLNTFGGNLALGAAAYNAGPRAVSRWLENGEELPLDLWVARIPYSETRGYVGRVLGNWARYQYLSGGESAVPELNLELPRGVRAPKDAY